MKLSHDVGPRKWLTPLVGEDGREPDTTRWWESERILLVTSLQGGDMVHLLLYDRDDDEEMVPWGHELGPDHLPLGTEDRIHHCAKGEDYSRVWTLDRLIGLPADRVPGITNALGDAYAWLASDGTDTPKD